MKVFFVASTKLQALLVHVPDVLRGKVGVGIKDALQQAVEMFDICTVEILHAFWIQVAGPRKIELGMALFESPEPVLARDVTTQLEHEALDGMPVKRFCRQSPVINPIHKCRFLLHAQQLVG